MESNSVCDDLTNSFVFDNFEKFVFFNMTEKAYLAKVDGEYNKIFDGKSFLISQNLDMDSILLAQMRNDDISSIEKDYKNIYLTYIPAKELSYLKTKNLPVLNEFITDEILTLIKIPLLKICDIDSNEELKKNGFFECVLSGRRSAIMFSEDNIAIRLKGCGNMFKGFELGKVSMLGDDHFEIFGCQFKNTCLREQFISREINKKLQEIDYLCGNYPIGFWKYDCEFDDKIRKDNENLKGIKNEAKLLDKYCGLFTTLGEKRLGHHFFKGYFYLIEKIFCTKNFISYLMNHINLETFIFALSKKKIINKINCLDEIIYPLIDEIFEINEILNPDMKLFDLLKFLENETNNKKLEEELFIFVYDELENLIKNGKQKILPEDIKLKSIKLIENIKIKLREKNINFFFALILVFSNIAFELGKIKKCMENSNFNWGTYEYHCNSHLDNLLLIKKNKNKKLLSPIDFDLAFYREEFIDLKYKDLKGIEANLNFDDLILREKNYLLIQLLGINPIPNIDVDLPYFRNIFNKIENDIEDKDKSSTQRYLENLENLLKENISLYYSKGINSCDTSLKLFEDSYELIYLFVELILIIESLI